MNATVLIGDATLYLGDCLEAMHSMEAESVTAFVTDPPYALTSKHGQRAPQCGNRNPGETTGGFMGMRWDAALPGVPFWSEALRIAKPGAFLLAFGGTRTWHRLVCAIEDAGWEIRDCLMWLYGQGFPKSHDVSKAARKRMNGATVKEAARLAEVSQAWAGYGTALKPAWEPILVCMKPLDGTYAENALKHGVAGLNVDGCRIASSDNSTALRRSYGFTPNDEKAAESETRGALRDRSDPEAKALPHPSDALGRWPANVVLDEESARLLDEQTGERRGNFATAGESKAGQIFGYGNDRGDTPRGFGDTGGASRFFYCAKASRAEREAGLEGMPLKHGVGTMQGDADGSLLTGSGNPRDTTARNTHPTVKPLALMRWLVRLVKPPVGGVICDPFIGSGTTGMACAEEGVGFVGMEIDPEYFEIARRRIEAAQEQLRLPV